MPLIRRGGANKRHAARRAWLADREALTVHVPGLHDDVTELGSRALTTLCDEMQRAGLFGAKRPTVIQRETVRRLVSELRGEGVGHGTW